MSEAPFNVRVKLGGEPAAFTWRNIFAESPIQAAHRAFQENYWPERFDVADPLRLTVTVTQVRPQPKES